eukprot:355598-Chlamydomonas_euryale.AAC.1
MPACELPLLVAARGSGGRLCGGPPAAAAPLPASVLTPAGWRGGGGGILLADVLAVAGTGAVAALLPAVPTASSPLPVLAAAH